MAKPNEFQFLSEDGEQAFLKWFWTANNGNELLHKLNAYSFNKNGYSGDFIRREKHSPFIYGLCLVIEESSVPLFQKVVSFDESIRIMKVGKTEMDTTLRSGTRTERISKEITKTFGEDEMVEFEEVFNLPVSFVDTSKVNDVEKRIRSKIGVAVEKNAAQLLKLPYPTEWIFTSKIVIDKLKEIKNKQQYNMEQTVTRMLTTEIFNPEGFTEYGDYDPLLVNKADRLHKVISASST